MVFVCRCTAYLLLMVLAFSGKTAEAQEKSPASESPQRFDKLGDPLPNNAIMRLGTKRLVHKGGGPSMITLSKDERIVFSMDDKWVMAWSTESGKLLWERKNIGMSRGVRIGAAGYGVRPMCIVPNSGEVVTPGHNGNLRLWNPESGKSREVKSPSGVQWKSVDVSPDSELFAIGGATKLCVCEADGKLRYEIENKAEARRDPFGGSDRLAFGGEYSYARFSPDGKVLALVNSEQPKTIRLYEASTGKPIRDIKTSDKVVRMDFAPDSTQVVASERDSAARLYDIGTAKQVWEFVIPPPPNIESYTSDIAFRPDGKQVAVGAPIGSDYRIRMLNSEDGKEQGSLSECGWKPWPIQYTRDSKFLYGSGWSADIHKWDANSFKEEPLPGGAVRASSVCAMSGDGKHLVFANTNGIQILDVESEEITRTFQLDGVTEHGQLTFNHDGSHLAAGYSTASEVNVVIWDVETENEIHRWSWAKGRDLHSSIEALAFSEKGNRIAAAVFRQNKAYVFDLPSDKKLCEVKHGQVYGLDIDNDGSTLYTTGWDKTIRAWKTRTGKEIKSLAVEMPGQNGRAGDTRAYGLKLSSDEKLIATCDMTQKVRLFDDDLQSIGVIDDPGWFTFGTLAISPNDLWLGTGTGDGVKVFDIASGKQVFVADAHDSYICNVDFGAQGKTIISGGSDSVCYLWDIVPQSNPEGSSANADAFQALVGSDGEAAYKAYMQLSQQPEAALELLEEQLSELVGQEYDDKQVTKWIVGLGSDSIQQKAKAASKLLEFGPAVYDQLSKSLEGKLTDAKRESLTQIRNRIHRCYRRATVLVAELETPRADSVIDDLLKKSKTKMWKLMVFEAKKNRKK